MYKFLVLSFVIWDDAKKNTNFEFSRFIILLT